MVYVPYWPFRCSSSVVVFSLHYENTPVEICWKFYHQKKWNFSDKHLDIFHISAQNIDCGYPLEPPRRGGYNEYPQSMFLSRNKNNNNVYPCKPQFYYIKVGYKGVKVIKGCFRGVCFGSISGVCVVLMCLSSILLFVPQERYALWLLHFLVIFTYMIYYHDLKNEFGATSSFSEQTSF